LRESELSDFAARVEAAVKEAVKEVAESGSLIATGDGQRKEFVVELGEEGNSLSASGLLFERPWPTRYEAVFTFDGFASGAGNAATGDLLINFVYDDRADPPAAYALFRGVFKELGPFEGTYTVHGELFEGALTALVTGVGRQDLTRSFGGRAPKDFISYVSTVAGTGEAGFEDGDVATAKFNDPSGVFVDPKGRIFVADTGNGAVREIGLDGRVSALSTAFVEPYDLGMDGIGLLVVSDKDCCVYEGEGSLSRVVTDGILRGLTLRIVGNSGRPDSSFPLCNNFSCDGRTPQAQMQWLRGIDVQGGITLVAQWALPEALRMVTMDGMVMTLNPDSGGEGTCDGGVGGAPYDVVQGNGGEIYYTSHCNVVRILHSDGTSTVLAGRLGLDLGFKDGIGTEAQFSYPGSLVFDGERYLYLVEWSNSFLRRVDTETGEVVRVAGCRSNVEGFDCVNTVGFRDGHGDWAQLDGPQGLALDKWGDIYIADGDNHAIRLVRMINDPERTPSISRIQPLALQQGARSTVTVTGRGLALAESVDLGQGLTAQVTERGYRKIVLEVSVADDAEPGPRTVSVATPFGDAATPDGMSLNIMDEKASRSTVRTIAGTGDWTVAVNDLVPAEQAMFAFPGGIAAIDEERLLVADPLEQRIRLITTKDGAARELLELAAYEAGGQIGLLVLQGIEGFEELAGDVLGLFGADNFTEAPREEVLKAIEAALDEICEAADSDCEYMALPWAGLPGAAGDTGGFRLSARLFLPTDVAVMGDGMFLIADSGNYRIKTVGIDFSGTDPKPAPYIVASADRMQGWPAAVDDTASDTAVAATSADSTLAKVTLRDGSSVLSDFAGVDDAFRCSRNDEDFRQPMGVPMGISSGSSGTFIADPYCKTIWTVSANGEVADIRGDLEVDTSALPECSDGPLMFATWGAPMDVSVDSNGNIWVVDAGCHSVRVIKDVLGNSSAAERAAKLGSWAGTINRFLKSETVGDISQRLQDPDLGSLDAARYWVVTVAGSPDGKPGFSDGPASEALFNAPVAISVAEKDGDLYVFVSDVGNKRIRLLTIKGGI
jgi:hypothetical protein